MPLSIPHLVDFVCEEGTSGDLVLVLLYPMPGKGDGVATPVSMTRAQAQELGVALLNKVATTRPPPVATEH